MHKLKSYAAALALIVGAAHSVALLAAEPGTPAAPPATPSHAAAQSMNPEVWRSVINQMMQGQALIDTCAACHDQATVERYRREYGAFLQMAAPYQGMMNPNPWGGMMGAVPGAMNPAAVVNPAQSMMNPMTWMTNPMLGMINPMMMAPMMGMMNPMAMMPMMGTMNPMAMVPQPGMMNPWGGMVPGFGGSAGAAAPTMPMMDPAQYEQLMRAWMQRMPAPAQGGQPAKQ